MVRRYMGRIAEYWIDALRECPSGLTVVEDKTSCGETMRMPNCSELTGYWDMRMP